MKKTGKTVFEKWYHSVAKRLLPPFFLVLRWLGWDFRFINGTHEHIGHLATEPILFLKELHLGLRPRFREIWLIPEDVAANRHLLGYWREHLRIVTTPWKVKALNPVLAHKALCYQVDSYVVAINKTAGFPAIQGAWGERPPLLQLRPADHERGWKVLRQLGVPEGAWFVCMHNRESGFLPHLAYHNYRDADITSYIPAMQAVVERGGWCIRMGDKSMKPLPPLKGVIDYALSDAKSDWMDVFLCASCRAFLGSSSGLVLVANVFGVPAALANYAPMGGVLPYGARDVGNPKLYFSIKENRLLNFREVLDSPAANFRFTDLYKENGLKLIDNSPDEILQLCLELLEIASGKAQYLPEDEELQNRFKKLMKPGHYTYGARARIGRHFLKKHICLLD